MLGLPKTMRPRGLSIMSGSMEPNARKARLTWLRKRAEAKARPTWAKRSIGQRIVFLSIYYICMFALSGRNYGDGQAQPFYYIFGFSILILMR